jgi:methyl-accepting chemotaxis protein
MRKNLTMMPVQLILIIVLLVPFIMGCSKAYYDAMEKMGIHKRDILINRVEDARDAQSEAQEQFKSALDQFGAVVHIENSNLKIAYEKLNREYEDSERAAAKVSKQIDRLESVANALFKEWESELKLYKSEDLRRSSRQKLKDTKTRYNEMLAGMHRAENSMEPVLRSFRDNVLFLKHNLNAQAIGSLRLEFTILKREIDAVIEKMNLAVETSNKFISDIQE